MWPLGVKANERSVRSFTRCAMKVLGRGSLMYVTRADDRVWAGNEHIAFVVHPGLAKICREARSLMLLPEQSGWAFRDQVQTAAPDLAAALPTDAGCQLIDSTVAVIAPGDRDQSRLLVEVSPTGDRVVGVYQPYFEFLCAHFGHGMSVIAFTDAERAAVHDRGVVQWRATIDGQKRLVAICMPMRIWEIPSFSYSQKDQTLKAGWR